MACPNFKNGPKTGLCPLGVKLTLVDVEASINMNERPSPSFHIKRGVRQGYPLAPLLFLIMGETRHAKVQQVQNQGRIKGVK
jgi:hypothetical protein